MRHLEDAFSGRNTLSPTQAHVAVLAVRTNAAHVAVLVAGAATDEQGKLTRALRGRSANRTY
jgi:hypothetical protein